MGANRYGGNVKSRSERDDGWQTTDNGLAGSESSCRVAAGRWGERGEDWTTRRGPWSGGASGMQQAGVGKGEKERPQRQWDEAAEGEGKQEERRWEGSHEWRQSGEGKRGNGERNAGARGGSGGREPVEFRARYAIWRYRGQRLVRNTKLFMNGRKLSLKL